MNQDDLKTVFREQELKNRVMRNFALIKNAEKLAAEKLSFDDMMVQERAVRKLREYNEQLLRETAPRGYWRRLWWALRGGR